MSTPVFIAIALIAVTSNLYILKKGINVGILMLLDSVFLVMLAGISPWDALEYSFYGLVSDKTIKLILVLFLIMMLENIMRNTGMISAIVQSLKELVGSNRIAAGLLPAVIGLLPSPGGARFSCPMVEELTEGHSDDLNRAFVNYWFRHIWLDGFILYPGAILASELLEISVIRFFVYLLPFIMLTGVLGAVFGLKPIKKEAIIPGIPARKSLKTLLISMLPITILIIIYIILLNYTGYSLQIASGLVVAALFIIKKYSMAQIWSTARKAFPLKLVFIIAGVMIFKEILLQSGVMNGLPGLMERYNIPVVVLFILLPMLGGISSGITVSFVSMTFPVLIPLGLGGNIWYAVVAFASGTIGGMVTPLHLCAVISADYFKTPTGKMLAKVALVESIFVAVLVGVLLVAEMAK